MAITDGTKPERLFKGFNALKRMRIHESSGRNFKLLTTSYFFWQVGTMNRTQCFGSVYVFYGSGSIFFPNTDPEPDCSSIRIRIQVKTTFFQRQLQKYCGKFVFQPEK